MGHHLSSGLVSIVVVSLRRGELLRSCLAGVAAQTHPLLECFVFLNGADEAVAGRWRELYPAVSFIPLERNALYAAPQNRGISISAGEFVLCLNDDVRLFPSYIARAVAAARQDRNIGAVAGCLLREDGLTVDSTGLLWSRSRKPEEADYGRPVGSARRRPRYVFGAGGAAAFYRRGMLEDVKDRCQYFDENLGFFYEDFDLAWRMRKKGWKGLYCPGAVAIHRRGTTARSAKRAHPKFLKKFAIVSLPRGLKFRYLRNRYATMAKNDSLFAILISLPWILFHEIGLWFYLLLWERRLCCVFFAKLKNRPTHAQPNLAYHHAA